MRRSGYHPGTRAAQVIGDALHAIDPSTASDEAQAAFTTSVLNDRLNLPRRVASIHDHRSKAHHECGHVMAALEGGATDIAAFLRSDATGQCTASNIADPEADITFSLAGSFAEIKFRPASIHDFVNPTSFDFLMARGKIDALNASRLWPKITYRGAAKTAMRFVEKHWRQIETLALVLAHSGEICDADIRLFLRCKK